MANQVMIDPTEPTPTIQTGLTDKESLQKAVQIMRTAKKTTNDIPAEAMASVVADILFRHIENFYRIIYEAKILQNFTDALLQSLIAEAKIILHTNECCDKVCDMYQTKLPMNEHQAKNLPITIQRAQQLCDPSEQTCTPTDIEQFANEVYDYALDRFRTLKIYSPHDAMMLMAAYTVKYKLLNP